MLTGFAESLFPLSPLRCQNRSYAGKGKRVENSVPEALIVDIFTKLPVKSLIRFMCLSKSCYQAISDPQFFSLHLHHSNQSNKQFLLQITKSHLNLHYMSFCHHQLLREPVTLEPKITLPYRFWWEMVGSCNGVLCLTTSPQPIHYLGILNPSIKKFKLVLFPHLEHSFYLSNGIYRLVDGTSFSTEIGFGFDSCTSDFKIVIIFREIFSKRWREVQVYSQRQKSWKVLGNVSNFLYNLYVPQVVVNGAFYWVVNPVISVCYSILMFDFTDETFKEIRMPDCFYKYRGFYYDVVCLGEVKGKLSLLYFDVNSSARDSLEMWMMEDSGWIRQFVVNVRQLHSPICLAMNDKVMLLSTCSNVGHGHILSCDLKTLRLTDHGEEWRRRAFAYTPSLALLGEES